MAYEAEGKTDQAIGLYAALSKSPMEQIKTNADKLLYGLEAMNFMRNEVKLQDFARKKAAETFIETTGFNDISKVRYLTYSYSRFFRFFPRFVSPIPQGGGIAVPLP
jgi:hypothetical protein